MRLSPDEARTRFGTARVARLATVTPDGRPHAVPIVFALDGDTLVTAVDAKPKSTTALQRLANIAAQPSVCVLADHYADDWTQLWWARADGTARITDDQTMIDRLVARYPQYADQRPAGPAVAIAVARWSGWAAASGNNS